MFASAFTLAPLIFLIINLIDIRVDAKRLLWLYKRPIGYRAQDIGKLKYFLLLLLLFLIELFA